MSMPENITRMWLKDNKACAEACNWIDQQGTRNTQTLIDKCLEVKGSNLNWLNWYLSRILSRKNKIRYAIYAAEQVIDIYEKEYPNNKRPRRAIEAAKEVLRKDNEENRNAAFVAADVATAAATAAAIYATYATHAAYAAYAAAYAAYTAAYAVAHAAYAAHAAHAAYAEKQMKLKILTYGIKLLKGEK